MKYIIYYSVLLLVLVACGQRDKKSVDYDANVKVIQIKGMSSHSTLNYSDVYSKVHYVPLEFTADSQIGNIDIIEITNSGNYIIFDRRNGSVVQFDKDGKYINNIGQMGHGPGEYVSPEIVRYNMFTDQIIVYDGLKHSLLHYDTNGNTLSTVQLHKYICNFGIVDSTCYVIYANHLDDLNVGETAYNFEIIDADGGILKQFEPYNREKMHFNPSSNNVFWRSNGKLLCLKNYYPYVYTVTKNEIKPVYRIDSEFGQFSTEWLDHRVSVSEIEEEMTRMKYSDLWMFGECANKYVMMVNFANEALLTIVMDKHDKEKIYMGDFLNNDICGLVSASPSYMMNEEIYGIIDSDQFMHLEDIFMDQQKYTQYANEYQKVRGYKITDDDREIIHKLAKSKNPVIQVCTLK